MSHRALYPGTFDPITNGHVDVVERAARLFDFLIVGIYAGHEGRAKQPLFSAVERRFLAEQALRHLPNVRVDVFSGLAVDYARAVGAQAIVRGLRAVSDFEYEFSLAHMYRHLAPDVDVVCLMTSSQYSFISSSMIKEVAQLGGNLTGLVPDHVAEALVQKFRTLVRE
ncbi:MAG: pantetheine-phosphate adenylyltransferase [Thermomicrobium sp.]|uniref:pantetheine-phosphate adenylyltransferase n=1 Tax=Thermomicrobium sp. TaxID=1969469 RepID=UPI001B0A510E|nr:pantetheine-phosphate adenylyltransferase [Thermomicrobium sp.]MBO9350323.1 pantetheine-phosphate adenylyltransferase [Thermomicrobium sp.]